MKKRFLAVILALVMCAGLAPAAFAAESDFVIEDGVLTEYNGPGGDVVIPDGVTSIGDYAFYSCTGLTSVTIPDSVTSIGNHAFEGCTSLTSVTIPDSVTSIGNYAFYSCTGLTSVTIPDSVTSIGYWVFCDCTGLTSVTIPASVTGIGWGAFSGCTGLTSVIIPDGVTEIGGYAFHYCTGLTSVTIPDSVTSFNEGEFCGCTGLTSVTIPSSVTWIGTFVFADCTGLTSVTIPASVTGIGWGAFSGCTGLTSVTIPDGVTNINIDAFAGCTGLTDVYFGGTQSQWESMTIEAGNNDLTNANIHYNGPTAEPEQPAFTDMEPNAFYLNPVAWAVEKNVTTGKTATTFVPNENCTHGQILTFLWRAAGKPESSAQPPIAMKGDEFYYGATKWAAEKGMIGGNFDPKAGCTRADAVNYIWQAFGKPAATYDGRFTDVPAGSPYATAVAWALANEVTTGATATTFNPNGICNRGEIVTFLYRAYK